MTLGAVHLRMSRTSVWTECGRVGNYKDGPFLRLTVDVARVTCRACKRTHAFRDLRRTRALVRDDEVRRGVGA